MSLGTIGNYDIFNAVQHGKAVGNPSGVGRLDTHLRAAFDTQMRMTQSLFGEGLQANGEGSSSVGFDTSLVNDATMLDVLTTITRLMRSEAGLPRQRAVAQLSGRNSPMVESNVTPDLSSETSRVGNLSARFESGSGGVATIGYDRVGGTSYGKYQIASRPGTMDRFLAYLDEKEPEMSQRLREAGPANTGSKEGGMPAVWKELARENPGRFGELQHDFIAGETYTPARNMILKQTGLDFDNAPPALREVLWSTAVQHGPTGATKIFGKVINRFIGSTEKEEFNAKLIEGVYDTRKGQFASSTKRVQAAVVNRLNEEKAIALNMLGEKSMHRIV